MNKVKLKTSTPSNKKIGVNRLNMMLFQRNSVVYVKLSLGKKSISFSTGFSCRKAHLNTADFSIDNDEIATTLLQALRTDLQRTYADFVLTKRVPDLREIRDIALQKDRNMSLPTLIECLEKFLKEEFEDLEGIDYVKKTVEKKQYIVQRIKDYIITVYGNSYVKLSDIKAVDAPRLVNHCKKKYSHGHNHAVLHAEFLKRVFNYAIANEWIDKNPFVFFKPKRERKAVVALTESEILKLEKMEFHVPQYNYVKDVFLFCCYTGLSYIDINRLDRSFLYDVDTTTPLIRLNRGKNSVKCVIPLVPKAIALINKYANDAYSNLKGKLFPVYCNQAMNRILKEIQMICALPICLTTHVARKTCASYYIANGVPVTSVALMLGHVKTSTTEQYYTKRSEEAVKQHLQEFQLRKGVDLSSEVHSLNIH